MNNDVPKKRQADAAINVLPAQNYRHAQGMHFLICVVVPTLLTIALLFFLPQLWSMTGVLVFIGMYRNVDDEKFD